MNEALRKYQIEHIEEIVENSKKQQEYIARLQSEIDKLLKIIETKDNQYKALQKRAQEDLQKIIEFDEMCIKGLNKTLNDVCSLRKINRKIKERIKTYTE